MYDIILLERPGDKVGSWPCETEVAQQVGSLAEDRLGHAGVVSADVLSVTKQ
jgi:hypothetical protein